MANVQTKGPLRSTRHLTFTGRMVRELQIATTGSEKKGKVAV